MKLEIFVFSEKDFDLMKIFKYEDNQIALFILIDMSTKISCFINNRQTFL